MNTGPLRAVIDASVAVKLFVPEAFSAEAHSVFAKFSQNSDSELIVPGLFFAECANVFWKWVQRTAYPEKDAVSHLSDLTAMGLTSIPTQLLAGSAMELALKHKITAYDACYLAAALHFQLPLITADERLIKQANGSGCDVQWLGTWQPA